MSHASHVQHEMQPLARDLTSGIFRSSISFRSIGVLGCEAEYYAMPRKALTLLATYLCGEISEDLPPFLVACKDGMVLVLTLQVTDGYVGGAIFLRAECLEELDKGIYGLWARLPREQDAEDFFKDTSFPLAGCLAYLPPSIEAEWKSAFC